MTNKEKACVAISREYDKKQSHKLRALFDENKFDKILATTDIAEVDALIRNCAEQNIQIVTRFSSNYPKRLFNLGQPPYALYCRGNLELLQKPAVAIVGTRDCTRYGQNVATDFAKALAKHGIVVVSGLAEGIDTASHNGAVEAAKKTSALPRGYEFPSGVHHSKKEIINTIAVLGNGLNVVFPSSNRQLQKQLSEQGLVISEFLPNTPCARFTFPFRNRIVAALASAVIIVEADLKSGTMITRDWALELGVDVFAVPGPITSHASRGTNAIIREAQCSILTDIRDILDVFGVYEKSPTAENAVVQLSFEEKSVLDIIKNDETHFDDIVMETGFATKKLTTLLTTMELNGLIKKLGGNLYCRTKTKGKGSV